MFHTLYTTSMQGQKNVCGSYQSFGQPIFKASSEEQEYSYGPFQQGFPLNSTISVYKEDNLYGSYQQRGPPYLAAGVQGQEHEYGAFQQCGLQHLGHGNAYVTFPQCGSQHQDQGYLYVPFQQYGPLQCQDQGNLYIPFQQCGLQCQDQCNFYVPFQQCGLQCQDQCNLYVPFQQYGLQCQDQCILCGPFQQCGSQFVNQGTLSISFQQCGPQCQDQCNLCGPFQQGGQQHYPIHLIGGNIMLYNSFQQNGLSNQMSDVNNQDNQHNYYTFLTGNANYNDNLLSMAPDLNWLNPWQLGELKLKQEEELQQALKTLSDITLSYIDQAVTSDWTVTDCEDILHLMSWSHTKHAEFAFNVLLRNKLHDNIYEAARNISNNEFVCNCIWLKLIKMLPCDGKTILGDSEVLSFDREMLPFDSEEDCSLLLKLFYIFKTKEITIWSRLSAAKYFSLLSVAKYFPKLVNVKYCELMLIVVFHSESSYRFTEAVSAISADANLYDCLFEACFKFMKHHNYSNYNKFLFTLNIFCAYWKQLQSKKQKNNAKQLIIKYRNVISSTVKHVTRSNITCDKRQLYCMILLHLLHHYDSTKNEKETVKILAALTKLKVKLWKDWGDSDYECYCYGGTKVCDCANRSDSNSDTKRINVKLFKLQIEILMYKFKYGIFYCDCSDDWFGFELCPHKFEVMNDVSAGKIKFNHYLESLLLPLTNKIDHYISDGTCADTVVFQFSYIMEKIIDHNKAEEIINVIKALCQHEIPTELRDLLAQGLFAAFKVKYFKQTVKFSKLILDMNLKIDHCEFLDNLTLQIIKLLDLDGNKEEVLYKCFCILRRENRNNSTETNTTEIYREHFTFISRLEKEEEMKKLIRHMELVLLVMLLLISVSYGGHHSSAELKKYLSLKYEYDDAILYLLWCSGDVEINPGPTLKEIKKVQPSVKKRNWIYCTCSALLKRLIGISSDEKNLNQNLWSVKPKWWSTDEDFFDPRNPNRKFKRNSNSETKASEKVEKLLRYLIDCCNQRGIIPHDLQNEITARKNKDNTYLDHQILKQEVVEIRTAIQQLVHYKDTPELTERLQSLKISINFCSSLASANKDQPKPSMADVIKDIKVTLVRVSHKKNPLLKCTGLSKKPPEGLQTKHLQLYKTAKTTGECKELIEVLINYCEQTDKKIPKDFRPVIKACTSKEKGGEREGWNQKDMDNIRKCYTIWSYVAKIEHSLKYLQVEELLLKHNSHDELKELKELIDIQSWERNQYQDADDEATSTVSPQPGPSSQQGLALWGSYPSLDADDEVTSTISPQPGPSPAQHLPLNNHNPQGSSSLSCSAPDQHTLFVQKTTVTKTTGKGKRKSGKNEPGCTAQKRQFVCHDDDSIGGLVSSDETVPVDRIVLSQEDVQMVLELPSNISIGSTTARSSGVTQSYTTINTDGTTNTTVTVSQTSSPSSEQSSSLAEVMSKHCTDSDSNRQQIGSPTLFEQIIDDKFKQIKRELNL